MAVCPETPELIVAGLLLLTTNPAPPPMNEAALGAAGRMSNGNGAAGVPIEGKRELLRTYVPSGALSTSGRSGGGTTGTAGTTGLGGGSLGKKAVGGGMYSSILVVRGRARVEISRDWPRYYGPIYTNVVNVDVSR